MGIYFFLYTSLLILSFLDVDDRVSSNLKRYVLGACVAVFNDWYQFQYCFEHASLSNILNYDRYGDGQETMEAGYMFLNWVIGLVGNYTLFLIITNFILLLTWAYLSYIIVPKRPIMAFSLVMVTNMLFPVRLQLAAGIICWSIYYLQKNDLFKYIIITIIACTFHKATLMVFPILLLLKKHINDYFAICLIAITLFSTLFTDLISDMMLGFSLLISTVYPSLANNIGMYSNLEIYGYVEKSISSQYISLIFSFILLFGFIWARRILASKNRLHSRMWWITSIALMRFQPVNKGLILRFNKNREKLHTCELNTFNIYFNCFLFYSFSLKFFDNPVLGNLMRIMEYFSFGYAISIVLSLAIMEKVISNKVLFVFYVFFYLYKMKWLIIGTSVPESVYPYYSIFDETQRLFN